MLTLVKAFTFKTSRCSILVRLRVTYLQRHCGVFSFSGAGEPPYFSYKLSKNANNKRFNASKSSCFSFRMNALYELQARGIVMSQFHHIN